ncbi:cyclic pyranopterin monophosphate synthase subunit MoaA [Aquabacterium commune]|uniref:GTP 3',8-cyclase n=1 Tax=Aquabacterium commune TaxID=70586 RepID=A0A4R6RCG3_9BURK|nr:GTP 3',8-cyclase MoaA [Aquabacterium commune]TDP83705.1 cyclic pyranopterin monophosphate synthase subunit MoaA [Aquabacterium commune]
MAISPFPTSSTPALVDAFGRTIDYLRVSVTDRCDLRCTYCLPEAFKGFEEPANWLSHQEMGRLVGLFVAMGTRHVRLTGGEPLTRRALPDVVRHIAALPGLRDLSLSTNGTRLDRLALTLREAGVQRLNISLDSLDADCMARITGRDCLADVLRGIEAARAAGFSPIKLNMVVQPGVNDHEVEAMVDFALRHALVLRLIEPMPMGDTGRATPRCDLSSFTEALAARLGLLPQVLGRGAGPARYWQDPVGGMSLGVITPMSQHFCETCNRVRLGVDGTLYLCLGQDQQVPLGALLRQGASDATLREAILAGIAAKPARHEFNERREKIVRFMAQTGG